ncbi:MAG TPA: SRPBCC family protein [Xanthobacteraceae bacterium]
MPMWEIIVIAVVVLIAAVLILAATKSGVFQVERATTIGAAPEKIFPLVNDFKHWAAWSPYEKKDPAMKRTFSGAATGRGAVYEWEGNRQVGMGRIEITDTSAPSRVTIKLDMIKPMEGHNIVDFTLEPRGAATRVTWAMRGACAYPAKVMGLFLNVDKMVGRDFETGLTNLKALAEK